ncbi:MAG: cytochrome P450, partial [Pseudomonadales bacterium]|nr:cytochrome P450 [Pseudomonadales bacterium]
MSGAAIDKGIKKSGYEHVGGQPPPVLPGGLPLLGHMVEFATNPYGFMKRASQEGGEVISFKMLNQDIVLLTGAEASNAFYRAPDEQLDQSAAYKLMTPIFGEGIIFDAPIERKNEQLRMLMPSLMIDAMKTHSIKVVKEVEDIIAGWGDIGEIEAVSFFKQLTINTASHCLLGREFRYEMSSEFADIYHDLEKGVNPLAYHFPNLPIPSFRKRDKARAKLQALVGSIIKKRKQQAEKPDDMFQTFIDATYKDGTKLTDSEITGMLLGAIFAGHHTSSGTAAWVLIELLKQPDLMKEVRDEIDGLFGVDGEVTFQSLREVPRLENVIKEVLRLHPPLIVLMRQVEQELKVGKYTIKKGDMVWASPPVTQRMEKYFPDPDTFDPHRYDADRHEDKNLDAYQPFGGGKHKCSGNAFALFQIKAIFCILLRRYEFELAMPSDTYQDDYSQMIVQPFAPCRIRYRRRKPETFSARALAETSAVKTPAPRKVAAVEAGNDHESGGVVVP